MYFIVWLFLLKIRGEKVVALSKALTQESLTDAAQYSTGLAREDLYDLLE